MCMFMCPSSHCIPSICLCSFRHSHSLFPPNDSSQSLTPPPFCLPPQREGSRREPHDRRPPAQRFEQSLRRRIRARAAGEADGHRNIRVGSPARQYRSRETAGRGFEPRMCERRISRRFDDGRAETTKYGIAGPIGERRAGNLFGRNWLFFDQRHVRFEHRDSDRDFGARRN